MRNGITTSIALRPTLALTPGISVSLGLQPVPSPALSIQTLPSTALRAEDGTPLRDENGNLILVD